MKVLRTKTEYMYFKGGPRRSASIQTVQFLEVTDCKHLGSTIKKDWGTYVEINHRIQSKQNNWKMSVLLCNNKIPSKVKGKILKIAIQPAMFYTMETVPVTAARQKIEGGKNENV